MHVIVFKLSVLDFKCLIFLFIEFDKVDVNNEYTPVINKQTRQTQTFNFVNLN